MITLSIELIATIFIYWSLDIGLFEGRFEMIFFAFFHAVSAFCNAGFSTISDGFYNSDLRFNYGLQIVLIITFFSGSLGFPIVANSIKYFKYKVGTIFRFKKRKNLYKPWVLNLNSRISLITTIALLFGGFVFFYLLEYNNTLAEFDTFGKIVNAMFSAATPRSAGLATIDMSTIGFSTVMLMLFLMWVGGAPVSTGGGIKTSTFAIATLNILSLAKGKNRIEVYRREISNNSVRRAFATISLSLIMIGFGIVVLAHLEPDKDIVKITFECFSAYSTVGLSMGITGSLGTGGKILISMLMLVGRISMLSIVIAVFKKVKQHSYRYPNEEMLIN
jgi:Trk-type K+ transport system membrane component